MKNICLIYSTDNWHSPESKMLIAVADCQDMAIWMIREYVKEIEEGILSINDVSNLYNIDKTQGYEGVGEFIIDYVTINTFTY